MTERQRGYIDASMLNPIVKGRRVTELSQNARPISAIRESVNATEEERHTGELVELRLERDRLADQLRALEALYEALQNREEYVALLAHDLRVELSGVQAEAQLLERQFVREGNGDSPQAKRVLAIVAKTRRINAMIQEWFKSRHLESGTMRTPAQAREISTKDIAKVPAEIRNAFYNMSSGVMQIGSLLLIKRDGSIVARTLSVDQIERLASASNQDVVDLSDQDVEDLLSQRWD